MLSIRGAHAHIPPPPKSIPKDIIEALNCALREREDILTLTARMFTICCEYALLMLLGHIYLYPILKPFLNIYKKDSIRKIHLALNCEDKVNALILRARLFHYPEGAQLAGKFILSIYCAYAEHILGVRREWHFDQLRPIDQQWIRDIKVFKDASQYFIILCTKAQAIAARKAHCLQIDVSFKMIHGNPNVLSCSAWNERENGKHTLNIG